MVSTHWAFYSHGKSPWYTFDIHWTGDWVGPTFGLHFLKYAYFICSSHFPSNGALWPSWIRGGNFECGRDEGFFLRFYTFLQKYPEVKRNVLCEVRDRRKEWEKVKFQLPWRVTFSALAWWRIVVWTLHHLHLFVCHCSSVTVTGFMWQPCGRLEPEEIWLLLSKVTFLQNDGS